MGTESIYPMPSKTALEPIFIKARNRWRVDVPASKSFNGKRVRAHFKTRQAARDYIDRIDGPSPSVALDPRLAADAEIARQRLEAEGFDMTLAEAVAVYIEAVKAIEGTGTLLDAAKEFRAAHIARNASANFGEAVTIYLDSRADLRDTTLKSYRYTLEDVCEPLHGRMLADLITADLQRLLIGKGATAARMHRANLSGFWRWACKPPRSWAKIEVAQAVETARKSGDADIQILRAEGVKALSKAAEEESHAAACAYAIAVFGGVRMAELQRLTWSNVLPDEIEIGRDVAKKHSRRLVPICHTLRAWLDFHRNGAKAGESIVPANWTDVSKSVRRRAGWAVKARLLGTSPEPTRGPWPSNACRHTCASVQVAIGTSLQELTFKFGHAGGHDTLRAHYVARLSKKEALAILAIGPNGTKIQLDIPSKKEG